MDQKYGWKKTESVPAVDLNFLLQLLNIEAIIAQLGERTTEEIRLRNRKVLRSIRGCRIFTDFPGALWICSEIDVMILARDERPGHQGPLLGLRI